MTESKIEANVVLIESSDGWYIRLEMDDGTILAQTEESFPTQKAAQAALGGWLQNAAALGADVMTAQ